MCQNFNHFSDILHHFVIPKLATSSIRVNGMPVYKQVQPPNVHSSQNEPDNLSAIFKVKAFINPLMLKEFS